MTYAFIKHYFLVLNEAISKSELPVCTCEVLYTSHDEKEVMKRFAEVREEEIRFARDKGWPVYKDSDTEFEAAEAGDDYVQYKPHTYLAVKCKSESICFDI